VNFTSSLLGGGEVDLFDFGGKSGNFAGVSLNGVYVGSLSRSGDLWTAANVGGYNFSFDQTTGIMSFAAIPEPGTCALAISGLLAVMIVLRKRRRTSV
jgi:hypothetical protein